MRRSMSEREDREKQLLWSTLCAPVARSQHLTSDTDFVLPRLSEGALSNTASIMIQLNFPQLRYILFNKSAISMLYFNSRIDLLDTLSMQAYTVGLNK